MVVASISNRLVDSGRRVLRLESAALAQLAEGLDADFARAVEVLLSAKGRIVVCGMGKSGHVARKVAATFASTGAPAQFVHPAEASHGDLGMITPADVVLVLSNSGETPELADILTHARRFSVPVIGVAKNRHSTLLQNADIALVLPDAPEACAVGMAPTTSTSMSLALGDALAISMMEHRDFSREDFHALHPRGTLGAKLLRVADLMHGAPDIPLVGGDTLMSDTLLEMTRKGFGIAGVCDADGRLAGVVTDGDLRRNMDGLLTRTAREVMTPDPLTIRQSALASEALALMNTCKVTGLFVTGEGAAVVGILHLHDCLRAGVA